MNGVISESVGRGDLLLLRNVTNRVGVKWERMSDPEKGYAPVDLTDWDCVFELLSPDGDVWYRRSCDAHGSDGKAVAYIPADAFKTRDWEIRRSGQWRLTAKSSDITEMLGWGYWTLEN